MAFQLEDGLGSGRLAKIDVDNHLHVLATTRTTSEDAIVTKGQGYNINSGNITLTTANESAVLYIKNNESVNSLVLTVFFGAIGLSTGGVVGTASALTVLRNPTAGTIITNAVVAGIPAVNQNFGSTREFVGDMFKGVEGDTFTDGTLAGQTEAPYTPTILQFEAGETLLPPGTSIGITYTPPASNTSMVVSFAFRSYLTVPV